MAYPLRVLSLFCAATLLTVASGTYTALGEDLPGNGKRVEMEEARRLVADSRSVDLAFLSARLQDSGITLVWRTLTESNNAGFRVQRKTGSSSWETVGFVESNAPGGTTSEAQSYLYTGSASSDDSLTYRLEQVDTDGTEHLIPEIQIGSDSNLPSSAGVSVVESEGQVEFGQSFEKPGVEIDFDSVATADTVRVKRFPTGPSGTDGISESNVSYYRLVIEADSLETGPGNQLRLEVRTLGGISDPSQVTIYKRPSAGSGSFSALSTSFISTEVDSQLVAPVEEFSEFVLASNSEPLPVEIASFNAQTEIDAVRLTWQTASEQNNAGFEVQRKEESEWNQMGYVESKASGGTTTEAQSYRYTATDLSVGTHQFRLKQVDLDGSSQVHGPISVDVQMQEALKLTAPAPNPVSSTATLSFAVKEQAEATVTVYDMLGRRVTTLYDGTPTPGQQQRVQMDASTLPSGAYLLRLRAAGRTETQRVTVLR